jgi:hypothetical protein
MLLLSRFAGNDHAYPARAHQGAKRGEILKYWAGAAALASAFVLAGVATVSSTPPAFSAEQYSLMAAPIPDDSEFDEDVPVPSLTPDEQAAIAVEDWG